MTNAQAKQALTDATAHHRAGRLERAEPLYRAVLDRQPNNADAMHALGCLLQQTRRNAEAVALLTKAAVLAPTSPIFRANLAETLRATGDMAGAIEHARIAIRLQPAMLAAHHCLSLAMFASGDLNGAIAAMREARRLQPNHAPTLINLGNLVLDAGEFDESIALQRAAAVLMPASPDPNNNIGRASFLRGDLDDAEQSFRAALAKSPDNFHAWNNLGHAYLAMGLHDAAIEAYQRALRRQPDFAPVAASVLMALHCSDRVSNQEVLLAHVDWAKRYADPITQRIATGPTGTAVDRDPNRRLRIGYVSHDFRDHPVACFVEPLLAAHDRGSVEVFCYSDVTQPDAVTARIERLADQWRASASASDESLAGMIRGDRIDVLIDLSGHTRGNRLLLFARKPAPIQISYLGWQNTTGMQAIGYRLTDVHLDPPGMTESQYIEQLLRLPQTVAAYRPPDDAPPLAPLPALAAVHLTFGSFARVEKITATTLRWWARLLQETPNAHLLIVSTGLQSQSVRARMLAALSGSGVEAERIEFKPHVSFAEYLALHQRVDLGVDTFPVNGHTTTCHALWMGVPTLSLAGDRYGSRLGLSVMKNIQLADQFVASHEDELVAKAKILTADVTALANLRASMRERLRASPLMDYAAVARDVEVAIRGVWRSSCTAG